MKFIEAVEKYGKEKRLSWLGFAEPTRRFSGEPIVPIEPGGTTMFYATPYRNFFAKNFVVSRESEPLLIMDVKQGNYSFLLSNDPILCSAFVMEKFEENLPERTRLHLQPVTEVGVIIQLLIKNPTDRAVRFEGAFFGEVVEGHDWFYDEEMCVTLEHIKATELGPIACFRWERGSIELPIPADRVGELMGELGRSMVIRLPFTKRA